MLLLAVKTPHAIAQYGPDPPGLADDAKCAWREMTLEYAAKLRPDAKSEIKSALLVGAPSNCSWPNVDGYARFEPTAAAAFAQDNFHVDGQFGDDSADGSKATPFSSIGRGVARCRWQRTFFCRIFQRQCAARR